VKVIKKVLKEELRNLLQMKRSYEQELMKLPKGSLVQKKVRDQSYYYVVMRQHGKVKCLYKGKISREELNKFKHAKIYKGKYRRLLSKISRQVKFLKGVLRSKELI
jgi:hypothetical protein